MCPTRATRGQRYPWPVLLTLVAAALVSGQRGGRAIGQWVHEHGPSLGPRLGLPPARVPSAATLRRTIRAVDLGALETRLGCFVAGLPPVPPPAPRPGQPPPAAPPWLGHALDGKAVRGANRHGGRVHLVSLVGHADGRVLAQVAVDQHSNEITAAPRLLAGRDLRGTVTTMDAQLTQRGLARQISAHGGDYLMVVKENQPDLYHAIHHHFTTPPPPLPSDHVARVTTVGKGHGRLETRTLERTAALNDALGWPGMQQVLRRTGRRVILATGEVQEAVSYGITNLPLTATAAHLEAVWRGHWGIENRVHSVRDVSFGEDAGQQRVGSAPQALAALRNSLVRLLRVVGWTSIADALRHDGAQPHRALDLLQFTPTRL
jgi:predicted transposase YbfD/YdcC